MLAGADYLFETFFSVKYKIPSIILTVIIDDDIYRFYFLTIAFFSFALVFVFNLFWKWYDSGKFINMFSIENIKKEICL